MKYIILLACLVITLSCFGQEVVQMSDLVYIRDHTAWEVVLTKEKLSVVERSKYVLVRSFPASYNAVEYQALVFIQPFLRMRDGVALKPRIDPRLSVDNHIVVNRLTYIKHLPSVPAARDAGYYSVLLKIGPTPIDSFELKCVFDEETVFSTESLMWWPVFENIDFLQQCSFESGKYRLHVFTDRMLNANGMKIQKSDREYDISLKSKDGLLMFK